MKELSIEERAKRYDEILSRAKGANIPYYTDDIMSKVKEFVDYLLPELKESEDERIRKELIDFLEYYRLNNVLDNKTILLLTDSVAWLEKQSTPQVRTGLEWVNTIDDACDKRYSEEYAHGEYCHEQSFKWGFQEGVDWLEKQGEQNLANSAKTCKDEKIIVITPKFRVGDVIRPKGSTAEYTIESISGECYHGKGWGLHISCEEDYELVEKKPAWSEGDNEMFLHCCAAIRVADYSNYEDREKLENWLKSLKDRVQPQNRWKPSDEQMEALKSSTYCQNEQISKVLFELYQDLKKLKE